MKWFENKTDKKDNKAFVVAIGMSESGTVNDRISFLLFPANLKNKLSQM
jgi:hypothetical protein